MTLDRRTFIVGTGIVAMTPAFEPWVLSAAPALTADVHQVEFMIEGWSLDDGSTAPNRVWITLDRSWRAAWR
jgi:hypothetical protein